MTAPRSLKHRGVALLATRLSVLGHDPCGGSEVVLWEDYRILQKAGIPVRVYGRAARNGALVTTLPIASRLPLVSSLEYCGRFLRRERNAVLIAYNEPMVAGLAPRRSFVRFDWSTALPRFWKLPGWLGRFRRAAYLFPSDSQRQLFQQAYPLISREATRVLHNAVDLERFRPTSCEAARSHRVGFAGQWSPEKGLPVLLEAWTKVRGKIPTAELWLAGGARLWKSSATPPGAEGIAERIRTMTSRGLLKTVGELGRAQMPDFWSSLSVAVAPSLRESFGLSALEALACGTPVVASAVGGLKEVVADDDCGLLVPPSDPNRLAEALVALLSRPELRVRMAAGARRRAEAFSVERRSQALLALLAERADHAHGELASEFQCQKEGGLS